MENRYRVEEHNKRNKGVKVLSEKLSKIRKCTTFSIGKLPKTL